MGGLGAVEEGESQGGTLLDVDRWVWIGLLFDARYWKCLYLDLGQP